MRSGNPLTAFVQTNRSRSLWAPSLGPGTGPDRPSYAPGRGPEDAVTGDPDRWFDPTAFVLQPIGTFGNAGRNDLIGPDLKTTDLAFTKAVPWSSLGAGGHVELRVEIFNLFNRVNFGPPSLVAFSGTGTETAPLAVVRPDPHDDHVGAADAAGRPRGVLTTAADAAAGRGNPGDGARRCSAR